MSWFANKELALYEPPTATKSWTPPTAVGSPPLPSTWTLVREWLYGVNALMYGVGRAGYVMAESCDNTVREVWPWVVLLLQIVCAIAALKLLLYVLHAVEELGGFVCRFMRSLFTAYKCVHDCRKIV